VIGSSTVLAVTSKSRHVRDPLASICQWPEVPAPFTSAGDPMLKIISPSLGGSAKRLTALGLATAILAALGLVCSTSEAFSATLWAAVN
jgi:hypothetical protein